MKFTIILSTVAAMAAATAAFADEPIVLSDRQLDQVTAGTHVDLAPQIKIIGDMTPDNAKAVAIALERLESVGHPPKLPE